MQQQEIRLDLVPFMAKGIAQNAAARRELDKICAAGGILIDSAVASRRQTYNSYFRDSDVYTELYCLKATDLIITSFQEDEDGQKAAAALDQLLKKCWKQIYTYIKTNGKEVRFESFWQFLMKKAIRLTAQEMRNLPAPPLPVLTGRGRPIKPYIKKKDMLDGDFAIFWHLTNAFGKTLTEQGTMFHSNFTAHLQAQEKMTRGQQPLALTDRQKELADELWHSIDQKLKGIPASLDEYFHTLEYTRNGSGYLFRQENFSGLPFDEIARVPVSRRELRRAIEAMAASLPEAVQATGQLKQAALDLFTRTLLIRACAMAYDKLRTLALNCIKQEDKTTVKRLQTKKLKAELTQEQKKNAMLEEKLAAKQNVLNELQLKIDKNEISRQKEREQWQAKLDEANQLLASLLASQKEDEPEMELSPETIEKIALLKVVIIGGRADWQQRLKHRYQSFTYISAEDVKFDLAVLNTADVIVINWKCLGHSLLYRAVQYAGKRNKRMVYLSNSNEKHMLEALCRECILSTAERS
ncbi:hypothetical protein [Sporomusa termitida]|uniref:DUF2325 domain-containing protein n=1 Tax=Sporomusa termitida TaxID=2377 RepID=A0A517DWQ7_9FIRM|nr:hypothetical protein [Sporomusa termitida]QDR81790.1 hypothetical protein SPTER_32030 [Sporomusa termitida]